MGVAPKVSMSARLFQIWCFFAGFRVSCSHIYLLAII